MQSQLKNRFAVRDHTSSMQIPPRFRVHRGIPLEQMPREPQRWRDVLLAILDQYNWAHATRAKGVSFKTMEERKLFLFSFFRELRGLKYWIDPRSLRTRHLHVMVEAWAQRNLSAATVQRYLSHLRVFCDWINKPGMVPDLAKLTPNPERFRRTYVADESRAWEDQGVVATDVVACADRIDLYVGAQLRIQHAFGLRVKEAIMLQPHTSVREVDGVEMLVVKRGTKGGREREIPIDDEAKRAALAHAQSVPRSLEHSLGDPARDLRQAYQRFYYVMRLLGVTRAQRGVTAHGLRHQFAADTYENHAGESAPVRGGAASASRDGSARDVVAEQLGHSRRQIVKTYIGSAATTRSKGG